MSHYEPRIQLARLPERDDGLLFPPLLYQQNADVVVRGGAARVELQGVRILLESIVALSLPGQSDSKVFVGEGIGGVETDQLIVCGNGVDKAAFPHSRTAALNQAKPTLFEKIDPVEQRILDVRLRLAASSQLFLRVGEIAQPAISQGQLIVDA